MGLIGRTSTDGSSSAAILDDGTLWVVGNNSKGQLGLGDKTTRASWTQIGTDTDWAKVYVGGENMFAIKTDGTLYGAGRNEAGTLGMGSIGVEVLTLTPVAGAPKTADIAAATFQTVLCGTGGGSVKACGDRENLGLQEGDSGSVATFQTVRGAFKNVFITFYNKFGINFTGQVYVWGNGDNGQLGNGVATGYALPTTLPNTELKFTDISAQTASFHTFLIFGVTTSGELYFWGKQSDGSIATPTYVMSGVKAASNKHIIKTDGSLWVQDGTDVAVFKQVDAGPWSAVHDGGATVILEKEDGTLWGYGSAPNALGFGKEVTVPTLLPISTAPAEYGIVVGDLLVFTEGDEDTDGKDNAVWHELASSTAITLNRADGELQKVTLTENTLFTAPILTKDRSTLLLQFTTTVSGFQVYVGSDTILASSVASRSYQVGWYWDGTTTRRYPVIEVAR